MRGSFLPYELFATFIGAKRGFPPFGLEGGAFYRPCMLPESLFQGAETAPRTRRIGLEGRRTDGRTFGQSCFHPSGYVGGLLQARI